jgi:hypothetical protein
VRCHSRWSPISLVDCHTACTLEALGKTSKYMKAETLAACKHACEQTTSCSYDGTADLPDSTRRVNAGTKCRAVCSGEVPDQSAPLDSVFVCSDFGVWEGELGCPELLPVLSGGVGEKSTSLSTVKFEDLSAEIIRGPANGTSRTRSETIVWRVPLGRRVHEDGEWGLTKLCKWAKLGVPGLGVPGTSNSVFSVSSMTATGWGKVAHCYKLWLRNGHYYRVLPNQMPNGGAVQFASLRSTCGLHGHM